MSKPSYVGAILGSGVTIGVFTVVCMLSSFALFITLSIILGAIGLLFMRRETPYDKLYINLALKTMVFGVVVYTVCGLYAVSREVPGASLGALLIFSIMVLPSYLAMSYMLVALFVRNRVPQQ